VTRAANLRMRVRGLVRRYESRLTVIDLRRAIASLVVVTMCGSIPLVSLWQVAGAAARDINPVATIEPLKTQVTPVLSVRRVAASVHIESQVSGTRLGARRLQRELPGNSCLLIRSGGRDVASYGASAPLIPGSNMKLLVAATALDVLGADYRYTTALRGTVSGRVVVGNLWLVGGGDPHLVTRTPPVAPRYDVIAPTFLDTLVDELVAQGVTTVTGSVVGDGTRYDDERFAPGWGDGIRGVEAGPLGGLVGDDGLPPGSLIRRPNRSRLSCGPAASPWSAIRDRPPSRTNCRSSRPWCRLRSRSRSPTFSRTVTTTPPNSCSRRSAQSFGAKARGLPVSKWFSTR